MHFYFRPLSGRRVAQRNNRPPVSKSAWHSFGSPQSAPVRGRLPGARTSDKRASASSLAHGPSCSVGANTRESFGFCCNWHGKWHCRGAKGKPRIGRVEGSLDPNVETNSSDRFTILGYAKSYLLC